MFSMIFGITSLSPDSYLQFGMHLLLHIFKVEENILLCLPSKEKIDSFVEAIIQKYPLLGNSK
eukprot:8038746-Ditylum_brightwellii.AAC.1